MSGKQLDELIKQHGYSRKYVAKEIGLSLSHLTNCLNGRALYGLSRSKKYRLAELLHIDMDF